MGLVLRYVVRFDASGKARVGVEAVRLEHPLALLLPCDNVFIESRWYRDNPLVICGTGAGHDVTVGAIQSDLLNCCKFPAPVSPAGAYCIRVKFPQPV